MTTYTELLAESDCNRLIAKEKPLRANRGRIKGNRIAIKQDLSETEKICILAEELGHYYTTSGNILDQNITTNRKQERTARLWAYNRLIGLTGLIDCYRSGCRSRFEMAEHLGVTEEFLNEAVECYKQKYSPCTVVDNYLVTFEPLGVLELYK